MAIRLPFDTTSHQLLQCSCSVGTDGLGLKACGEMVLLKYGRDIDFVGLTDFKSYEGKTGKSFDIRLSDNQCVLRKNSKNLQSQIGRESLLRCRRNTRTGSGSSTRPTGRDNVLAKGFMMAISPLSLCGQQRALYIRLRRTACCGRAQFELDEERSRSWPRRTPRPSSHHG